jgi:hypothetical protein
MAEYPRVRPTCGAPGRGSKLSRAQILLDWLCDRFLVYFLIATVRRLEPIRQFLVSSAGIAASTANGQVVFVVERSVIIEVLYGCFRGAPRTRGSLHQNMAIYALLVPCSNLSLILVRNAVCVGHGWATRRRMHSSVLLFMCLSL